MICNDMYLNENLFNELYKYNMKYNLDIIEFLVLQQNEGSNKKYYPKVQFGNHNHNYNKRIILQPELSNILYFLPGTKQYSRTICRNIWNKMIRKQIFNQASNYIGKEYYNEYIIAADDMLMNIITYQFANNFSNIDLIGYLYTKRIDSMSRGGTHKLIKTRAKNYVLYFKYFYKYIKDFKKNINFLYYEFKNLEQKIIMIKGFNMIKYNKLLLNLIEKIQKEKYLSNEFATYLKNLSVNFEI